METGDVGRTLNPLVGALHTVPDERLKFLGMWKLITKVKICSKADLTIAIANNPFKFYHR